MFILFGGIWSSTVLASSPLLYEPFNYPVGTAIQGQSGGTGWSGNAWSVAGSMPNLQANTVAGLTFGSYPVQGNALQISSTGSANWNSGFVARQISATIPQGEVWTGYLYRRDDINPGVHQLDLRVANTSNGGTGARLINRSKDGVSGWVTEGGTGYGGTTARGSAGNINDGNTYLLLARFTNVGISGGGTATWWALSAPNWATIQMAAGSGPVTVAMLDAHHTSKASISSTSTMTMPSNHFFQFFSYRKSGWEQLTYTVDELRVGTSLAAVAPSAGGGGTPPPTTVAPSITQQPASSTVYVGQNASFTAAASGTPTPTLQWQRQVSGSWQNVSGATSGTLNLSPVSSAQAGSYRMVASNSAGSATSNTATLTVHANTGLPGLDGTAIGSGQVFVSRVLSGGVWEQATDAKGFNGDGNGSDSLVFDYVEQSGDFQAVVNVRSLSGPASARAGLMLRETSATGARYAAIASRTDTHYIHRGRTSAGTAGSAEAVAQISGSNVSHPFPNKWLMIERVGNEVRVAVSNQDNNYTQVGSYTLSGLASTVQVGVFSSRGTSGDLAVAGFAGFTVIPTPPPGGFTPGTITREWWTGISGTFVSNLTENANYPNRPTGSDTLTSLRAVNWNNPSQTSNWADNYGQRIRGYIIAPQTGSYTFWISGDDHCQLWLGTSSDPVSRQLIASVIGWTSPLQWDKYSSQKSVPITLQAGQAYYVEVLQKEGTGGDHLAVGWARPGQSTSAPSEIVPGSALAPWGSTPSESPITSVTGSWSWIGNTHGGHNNKWVQNQGHAMWVHPDGRVVLNTPWDEGHREAGIYNNGDVLGKCAETGGGRGGEAVTGDGQYIYLAVQVHWDWNQKGIARYHMNGSFAGWSGAVNGNRLHLSSGGIKGLAHRNGFVYASDPANNRIAVIQTSNMTVVNSLPVPNAGQLAAAPNGDLWVIQTPPGLPAKIIRVDSSTGQILTGQITDVVDPRGLNFAPDGKLWVAESGVRQQFLIYTVGATPQLVGSFGVQNGVFAGPVPGRVGPDRHYNPQSVAFDSAGNIYVLNSRFGITIRSYTPQGALRWEMIGRLFVDCGSTDPGNEDHIYTKFERYEKVPGQPAGQDWRVAAHTANRLLYPDDPRFNGGQGSTTAMMVRFNGHKFKYVLDMVGQFIRIYRFNGEVAVPAGLFSSSGKSNGYPANMPSGNRNIWIDHNGDGSIGANEWQQVSGSRDSIAGAPDENGTIWWPLWNGNILKFPISHVNAQGVPVYDKNDMVVYPRPAPFNIVARVDYRVDTDTMYITGFTDAHPRLYSEDQQFISGGRVLVRYNNWSTPQRTQQWMTILPYASNRDTKAFAVAGGLVFTTERQTSAIDIYDALTGNHIMRQNHPPEVGPKSGQIQQDIPFSITARRLANGTYRVIHEEDAHAKNLVWSWIAQ
jgi:hypothetical protein